MKKFLLLIIACMVTVCGNAQIGDAFKGVWPVTDKAVMRSLNGEWQLKVVKGIDDNKTVPAVDDTWGKIPVPGCWEAYGFCEPKYDYPDSLTGYYRNSFTVPAEWKGQQIIIRLDGVLRGYDLWLNGQYVGSWESGYNTCQFDLTPYLTKNAFKGEAQQLAMRVYSQFKGYEFDCFDDWATMGIFRDVTLMAVPKTHLSDLTVTTKMNGEVTVKTEVANATSKTITDYEILNAQGQVVSTSGKIENPHLWTAETPYLYTLRVYVKEKGKTLQTFTQKIGIREISIEGNLLKLNGQPIKLRGVNAHSTDPKTVKVISDELTLKDMRMMKEASVNYMRLSHYPREPRFFELADSLGFYLVDEVPFGFGDKHLSNRKYQDILKTRALATVTRDKNHPSVLVWSVGNENPLPQTCVEVGDYVGQLDPSRPYCFPQVGSYFRKFWEKAGVQPTETGPSPFPSQAPVYAPHYPTTGQIGGFYQHLDRPVIFTEYCHTLGISFEDHDRQWEIIERTPGIAGGSVWEWADQGMPFKSEKLKDKSEKLFGYEEKVYTSNDGGFEMYGNKGTDGLLYADRTPLPNYYELQHNYARAFVKIDNGQWIIDSLAVRSDNCQLSILNCQLTCVNRYDFLNLKDNVTFRWALTNDRDTVARGTFSPDCAPRSSVPYSLELPFHLSSLTSHFLLLHFDIEDAQGHTFLHQSFVLNKPQIEWTGHGSGAVMSQETTIRTGRKPTMAERITQKDRLPQKYLLPIDNEQVKVDIVSKSIEGGEEITFTLTPDTADIFRSELGLAYLLDAKIDRVQWIGYGPFASYPGRHQANRYGFWAKHKDDLYFEGNHGGIDAAFLSDKDGNGILIVGDSLNLNFEKTDRGIVLTVNAAVSGQGPKFAKTHFPGWEKGDTPVSATFRSYYIKGDVMPQVLKRFFSPAAVPAPFKPFLTQYDTYLMKYDDIKSSKERGINLVFIGNSITYGALHEHREVTAPPAQCARWLSAQEGVDTVYFRNCGRSGRTTYHFLPRSEDVIPAGDKTYFGDVVAKTRNLVKEHPNLQLIFSIMLGTNDAVERKHNSHSTPDNYVKNLVAIIDSLLKLWPDAHVVLNKPIWNSSDYVSQGGSVATKKSLKLLNVYADRLKDVANRYNMGQVHLGDFDAYDYFEKNWKTDIFEEKDSRGKSYWLHPNEKGAEKLAEYWGKAIIKVPAPASASFRQEYGDARKSFVETIATPDHADSRYGLGQLAALRVVAREGGVPLEGTKIYYKVGPEMFLPEHYDSTAFVGGEALLQMGTMQEPGFLACQYEFRAGGKTYKDLVKVAYEPEQIKTFTPMPKDFEAFWQKALKDARKIPLEPEYFDVPDATNDKFVTKLVRLHVGKEKWMQGYLTLPITSHPSPLTSKYPVVLCPPGAGSQKIYPSDYFPKEGCIYMKIEIHDNDQRLSDEAYTEERKKCDGYMGRGMESRDTYYYKDVYVGCARIVDFLCSLPEWDSRNVIVTGGSQGGALTIITAALNEKVTMCAPFYPALCDVMGFLHHRAGGWPKFFSGFYKDGKTTISDDKAAETLQYFDVVNFARLLKVPTFMSWGYNDDTCSPTSIWAAWNEIKAPKEKDITPTSGHWRFPSSQAKCLEWIKENIK